MSKKQSIKPIALAIGAAFASSTALMAVATSAHASDTSPFAATTLSTGYMLADANEGKCGEGKCGEGKCGEGKGAHMHKAGDKIVDGKCGEGKCGEGSCGADKGAHVHAKDMKGDKDDKGAEGKCGGNA